jgi:sugar fermentation stimulation protein A
VPDWVKRAVIIVKFIPPFQTAKLIKRYKRFLADVELPDGSCMTIHCPNTGSMLNCNNPGSNVWYSTAENKKRKYPHTFEIIQLAGKKLAGINTGRANHLVREAIENKLVESLTGYQSLRCEVKYGNENSRIDFLLQDNPADPGKDCYIEVKNVTLHMGNGRGLFPDSVSTRGTKHLRELMHIAEQGDRAVLFFCVQHTGIEQVKPATEIDPEYSRTLCEAAKAGVEIMAWQAKINAREITLVKEVPVILPHQ